MIFKPFGNSALLIDFEQIIDTDVNFAVLAFSDAIAEAELTGFLYCIPAYCSITIGFDPEITSYDAISEDIEDLVDGTLELTATHRVLNIPVCYDASFGIDFDEVTAYTGLSVGEIVEIHTSTTFQVYMLGFLPGFAYMGKLPAELVCPRKDEPRDKVDARSVGIAANQTGIYPTDAPGGWQIIGKTPLPIFDPEWEHPFLFRPGDQVNFVPISLTQFEGIEQQIIDGTFNWGDIDE